MIIENEYRVIGPPGCIAGECTVEINRIGVGACGITRKMTLGHFVERFNSAVPGGLFRGGGYAGTPTTLWDSLVKTRIRCVKDGMILLAPVVRAIDSGVQEVHQLVLENGSMVLATIDHEFLTPEGLAKLSDLRCNDLVLVDAGTTQKTPKKKVDYLSIEGLKHHPFCRRVEARRYSVLRHRLVVEAAMNGVNFREFVDAHRSGFSIEQNWKYLQPTQIVHHKDENTRNNELNNLEVVENAAEHGRLHCKQGRWKDVIAKSGGCRVSEVKMWYGARPTYDLTVYLNDGESGNYLVNGIAVSNCGKTTYLSSQVKQRVDRWCSDTGEQPRNCNDVLVSSLTKAAANEVLSRGLELPDEQIGTLHAHALHALGNPKLCVGPKQISQWNKESKMDHWLGGGSTERNEDGFDVGVGKYRGDALNAEYTINRCRLVPREQWNQDVIDFANAYEKWKYKNDYLDYTDLIHRAYDRKVAPPGNPSTILVDECFPGWTPVQLADGTHKTIKEIVDDKLPVDVLSYDTASATQRSARVSGWSRIVNQRPLLKIKVRWLRSGRNPAPVSFVVCTDSHRLWANGEWREAKDIKIGDIMQVETEAFKSQRGKISARGKTTLSSVMSGKNKTIKRASSNGFISKRGGNGREVPLAECEVFRRLDSEWELQYILPTKQARTSGYPTHYKIDIANPSLKIAVEIDGPSHSAVKVKAADARKTEFLRERGWKVLRFTNREAIQSPDRCVAEILSSDCPIGAQVVSVEESKIPDDYVYDITVDDTHCFYANSILVHNCQDHDRAELRLLRYWATLVNKLIIVGDPDQNLYEWRGSDPGGFYESKIPDGHTKVLEQSYRVPRRVHSEAMQMIARSENRAPVVYHPRDEEGEVDHACYSMRHHPQEVTRHIAELLQEPDSSPGRPKVMCLFSCAYMTNPLCAALRSDGIPFWNPYSKERGNFNPLHPSKGVSTVQRLLAFLRPSRECYGDQAKLWNWSEFHSWVELCTAEGWLRHGAKANIKRRAAETPTQIMSLEDIDGVLASPAIMQDLQDVNLSFLGRFISDQKVNAYNFAVDVVRRRGYNDLLNNPRVVVGTIHSVKGAEADHVILCPDLSTQGWETFGTSAHRDSIHRLFYVGLTRAYRRLVLTAPSTPQAVQW